MSQTHNKSFCGKILLGLLVSASVLLPGCKSCGGEDTAINTEGCIACHSPNNNGIEEAHPSVELSCVECHGGSEEGTTIQEAHVAIPDGVSSPLHLRSMSSVELDEIPTEYIQWINPSDYRVTEITCGSADCHEQIVATAPSSIMTTFAGHFNKTRYQAGTQANREAIYAVRDHYDSEWTGAEGTVGELLTLTPPDLQLGEPTFGDYIDHYLEKGCPRCHVWNFGTNDARGDFRSSGCAGCHVVYNDDGLSLSSDPTVNPDDPTHPAVHELTTSIPDNNCEHCHYRGNRIGTMYRGIREIGRLGEETENMELSVQSLHTREPGFFVYDEDTTNDVDETPPDVHYTGGIGCVDCHMGVDVHGDGQLYSAHDYQVGVECEDCHGMPDSPIAANDNGEFFTTAGDMMRMLYTNGSGSPVMTGRLDGEEHELTQIADLELIGANGQAHEDMHIDSLECYSCHTSWTQSCFGCHPTIDSRINGTSLIDGVSDLGSVGGSRDWVTLDYLALGVGVDGKLTPMAPQEKMFVTVIVNCDPETEECTENVDSELPGRRLYDETVRIAADGTLGMGFGPIVPHTTSSESQPCDRCHIRVDESNWDIFNETVGWGSGRFVVPDGDGVEYDLTRVMDESCTTLVSMGHEGTATLSCETVNSMLVPRVENSGLSLREYPEWEAP